MEPPEKFGMQFFRDVEPPEKFGMQFFRE